MYKLYHIFKQHRCELIVIYVFMLLAELSILSQPLLLGMSIDGLLVGNYFWLMLLGVSYLAMILFNYKRMIYDTKVYTKIYNNIVFSFLKNPNLNASTKLARAHMSSEIVQVLEGYVHYYIATLVTIIGSIGFIYTKNLYVGLTVTIAFVFILLGVTIFYKKIKQSINLTNDHRELESKSVSNGYTSATSFYHRKRKLDIFASNLQGKNWFVINGIKHIFLLIAIALLVTTTNDVTAGDVVTMYSYVHSFLISLLSVPVGIEMYSRIGNILNRL